MKPKIYCFSNVKGGEEGLALALAEDGTILGSHWCSHEVYVKHDLGVTPGARLDRHEKYVKHYPDGYEMEFVPAAEVDAHEGLNLAYERNQAQAQNSNTGRPQAEKHYGTTSLGVRWSRL